MIISWEWSSRNQSQWSALLCRSQDGIVHRFQSAQRMPKVLSWACNKMSSLLCLMSPDSLRYPTCGHKVYNIYRDMANRPYIHRVAWTSRFKGMMLDMYIHPTLSILLTSEPLKVPRATITSLSHGLVPKIPSISRPEYEKYQLTFFADLTHGGSSRADTVK